MHIMKYVSDFALFTSSYEFYWDMKSISIEEADEFFSKWWAEDRDYLTIRFRNQQSVDKIRVITNSFDELTTNSHVGAFSRKFPSTPCEMLILKVWEPPNKPPKLYCDLVKNVSKSEIHHDHHDNLNVYTVIPSQSTKDQKGVESDLLNQLVKIMNEISDPRKKERAKKSIIDIFGFVV